MTISRNKDYLSELKRVDWDFTGENGTSGFSAYHWYPARYVPQLPGILINYFTKPGQLVLDPFCGSGTTLIEAYKFGRAAVGIELNPIAVLMTSAKLIDFNETSFSAYSRRLVQGATTLALKNMVMLLSLQDAFLKISNHDENKRWYHAETHRELLAIWCAIHRHEDARYFVVARAAFSAILRYCCSQDKHWGWICDNVKPKRMVYKNALEKFGEKLEEYRASASALRKEAIKLQEHPMPISKINVIQGDCIEALEAYKPESFDFVMTSPPYYNMTDYISSQRLSNLWFGVEGRILRAKEIGARYRRTRPTSRQEYLCSIRAAFSAIARVLKRDRFCCVVIGESPSHASYLLELEEICCEVGLKKVDSIFRRIPKQRSLSPRLYDEEILILKKGQE